MMRKPIFGMNVTLDGYIAATGDDIGWGGPSGELFQWWLDQVSSSTIDKVDWNTRLVTGDAVAETTRLKAEDGGPMRVGGQRSLGRPCVPGWSTSTRSSPIRSWWAAARRSSPRWTAG